MNKTIAAGGQKKRQGSQWVLAARLGAADHDSAGLRGTVPSGAIRTKGMVSLSHDVHICHNSFPAEWQ